MNTAKKCTRANLLTADPVSSATWHPGDAVLATCSGRRFEQSGTWDSDSSDSDDEVSDENVSICEDSSQALTVVRNLPDNKLNVWLV